jgi:hypothetical protein
VRTALVTVVAACLLCPTVVLGNPIIGEQVYIDFDPPNEAHSVYPALFEEVEAYVVVDLTYGVIQDFSSIYFRLATTPGTADQPSFQNLVPGAIVEGNWFEGISITTDCLSAIPPVPIGKLTFVYNGIPGEVRIEPHPEFPALLIDCQDAWFAFCVRMHGGVEQEAPQGDCFGSPVEEASWGAIKGLYR